jgi:uncharacterized membrane protein (UPF0127 family)
MFPKNGKPLYITIRRHLSTLICLSVFAVLVAGCHFGGSFRQWPMCEFSVNGVGVRCWVAGSPARYREGLREAVAEDLAPDSSGRERGMCFVFPADRIATFTMGQTTVPLELLLLSSTGRVLYVCAMQPGSSQCYSWDEPVRIALEMRAGFIARTGIRKGDEILNGSELKRLFEKCHSNLLGKPK